MEKIKTRGGYLAAIAKRKGISIDEARARVTAEQKRTVLDLAKKIELASELASVQASGAGKKPAPASELASVQASGSAGDDDAA